jgi:hypothetical protein
MNKNTTQAKVSEHDQMPASVRRAYAAAGKAAWNLALELAHAKAEADWRARLVVSEKQREELTAECAAHIEEKVALRAKVIDVETKADAKVLAAHDAEAKTSRLLEEITEKAQRVLKSADIVANHATNLKVALDAVQTSAQVRVAEIDAARGVPITRYDCIDELVLKGKSSTNSTLAPVPIPAEPSECRDLTDAEVVATAKIILAAASKLRAAGAFSAGHVERAHSVCGCLAEQTVLLDSPARPPES